MWNYLCAFFILLLSRCLFCLLYCTAFDPDVYNAAHILYFTVTDGEKRGNAVALSANKALAASHGLFKENQSVQLRDCRGISRNGKITFILYAVNSVDIALVELDVGVQNFEKFIPVYNGPVTLGMDIHIIGNTAALNGDETVSYYETAKISCIEPTSLVRANYHSLDDMSGAGVIVAQENGSFHVLGVHVGRSDETVSPPRIEKFKSGAACAASVSSNSTVTSTNIHGHSSCCLICVAVLTDGLVAVI
jgi:hypothetical protein